jgi:hypothetical protein
MFHRSHYASDNSLKDERDLHKLRANMLTSNMLTSNMLTTNVCSLCMQTIKDLNKVGPPYYSSRESDKTCAAAFGCTN